MKQNRIQKQTIYKLVGNEITASNLTVCGITNEKCVASG